MGTTVGQGPSQHCNLTATAFPSCPPVRSSFLRPDERAVRGSVTAFKALLDAMLREDRVAICRWE